jgi:hypothetical protein
MKGSFLGFGVALSVREHTIGRLVDQVNQPVRKIDPGQRSVVARKVDRPIRLAGDFVICVKWQRMQIMRV